eukprot:32224-Pelagomonas_calceolata.AAC.5
MRAFTALSAARMRGVVPVAAPNAEPACAHTSTASWKSNQSARERSAYQELEKEDTSTLGVHGALVGPALFCWHADTTAAIVATSAMMAIVAMTATVAMVATVAMTATAALRPRKQHIFRAEMDASRTPQKVISFAQRNASTAQHKIHYFTQSCKGILDHAGPSRYRNVNFCNCAPSK